MPDDDDNWEYISANDLKPGHVTRYGTVTEVVGAGRLRIVSGTNWQHSWHAGTPIAVLR